jgi:hypothetical protein
MLCYHGPSPSPRRCDCLPPNADFTLRLAPLFGRCPPSSRSWPGGCVASFAPWSCHKAAHPRVTRQLAPSCRLPAWAEEYPLLIQHGLLSGRAPSRACQEEPSLPFTSHTSSLIGVREENSPYSGQEDPLRQVAASATRLAPGSPVVECLPWAESPLAIFSWAHSDASFLPPSVRVPTLPLTHADPTRKNPASAAVAPICTPRFSE